jgi:hypothetical protein
LPVIFGIDEGFILHPYRHEHNGYRPAGQGLARGRDAIGGVALLFPQSFFMAQGIVFPCAMAAKNGGIAIPR